MGVSMESFSRRLMCGLQLWLNETVIALKLWGASNIFPIWLLCRFLISKQCALDFTSRQLRMCGTLSDQAALRGITHRFSGRVNCLFKTLQFIRTGSSLKSDYFGFSIKHKIDQLQTTLLYASPKHVICHDAFQCKGHMHNTLFFKL